MFEYVLLMCLAVADGEKPADCKAVGDPFDNRAACEAALETMPPKNVVYTCKAMYLENYDATERPKGSAAHP